MFVSTKIFKNKRLPFKTTQKCGNDAITELGFNRATGELDFIYFVRQQILTRSIIRLQTSKIYRYQTRQKVFDIEHEADNTPSESEDIATKD